MKRKNLSKYENEKNTLIEGSDGITFEKVLDDLAGKEGQSPFSQTYILGNSNRLKHAFFDGLVSIHSKYGEGNYYLCAEGGKPELIHSEIKVNKPLEKKPIALDFMGTMNSPQAKQQIWTAVSESIQNGKTDALRASGMTKDQLEDFASYLKRNNDPMTFRDYALSREGVKKAIGAYTSIGADAGQLEVCAVYHDVKDFLTVAGALGHEVEIFSTVGAPQGYKPLPEIMLENETLPEDYKFFLKAWGVEANNASDLISKYVVSKKKKSEPGQAVLEETEKRGLFAYVDDEKQVIDDTVNTFAETDTKLPVLCRMERDGVKDPRYQISNHPGIDTVVVANSLMDPKLLRAVYTNNYER